VHSPTCSEDALKKSEEMLESDAVKFDQFLRENEAKARPLSCAWQVYAFAAR
jgi:hypothetical protein